MDNRNIQEEIKSLLKEYEVVECTNLEATFKSMLYQKTIEQD